MFKHPEKLIFEQKLPIKLEEAWSFFSKPSNLAVITPDYMDFQVRTPVAELSSIYPGQIISYTLKPFAGIPIKWTTEITHVQDHLYFIDEQRVGPYKLWHHQHHFQEIADGVRMKDIVHYLLPMGVAGSIARKLFVAKQLDEIFEYRKKTVSELFSRS